METCQKKNTLVSTLKTCQAKLSSHLENCQAKPSFIPALVARQKETLHGAGHFVSVYKKQLVEIGWCRSRVRSSPKLESIRGGEKATASVASSCPVTINLLKV